MIIIRDDLTCITYLKAFLWRHFEIKDLGHFSFFLSLEVLSASSGYHLSQAEYGYNLFTRVGLINS